MPVYVEDEQILAEWIKERRELGADRNDEVWEGVYHVGPQASFTHDGFVFELAGALSRIVRRHGVGTIGNTNIRTPGSEEKNYRVPDLIFVRRDGVTRFSDDRRNWIEHGPDLLVEVVSPPEKPRKKFPFYAERGVPEIVVFDEAWGRPHVYRLDAGEYFACTPDKDGGLLLAGPGVRLFFTPFDGCSIGELKVVDERSGETEVLTPPDDRGW